MTVIVWDGKTLAADKQSTCAGVRTTVTKIFRVRAGLVGFMGNEGHARALLHWFRGDMLAEDYPSKPADAECCAEAILITPSGEIRAFPVGPHYAVIEDKYAAWGSGRDFAIAALHLGFDARRAAEVACALDIYCGVGIDELPLEP